MARTSTWPSTPSRARPSSQTLSGPELKELIKIYDRDIGAFSTRARTTYERVLLHVKQS
jgi:hypothetical protein